MIYLDNSATTRAFDEAAQAALSCMRETYFNPSSAYAPAVALERRINEARAHFASLFGHPDGDVIFTSGGTESNNMSVFGAPPVGRGKKRIVTSTAEHASVYEACRLLEEAGGAETVYLATDKTGAVDMDALSATLTPNTSFVSLMHVNNETGAVTNIYEAYARIRRLAPQAAFHVDGVQAFCKQPFAPLPCDLYAVSGHKFHAPKGIGALYIRRGLKFSGTQIGGGQERGFRSGTLNAPGILGMEAAAAIYQRNQSEFVQTMRACKLRLCENLLRSLPDVIVNGPAPAVGAPHILNLSFLGVRGEVLLHSLEQVGIYVSTGSACSAKKKGKSRVLASLGASEGRQESAVRFSFCPMNTLSEMDEAATAIAEQVQKLRRYQRR